MSSSQMLSVGPSHLSTSEQVLTPNPFQRASSSSAPPRPLPSVFPPTPSTASSRASSSHDGSVRQSFKPWPASDTGVVLFFDVFSDRANEVREGLERKLRVVGCTLNTASNPKRATHILLDPRDGELNTNLRARDGGPVHGREDEDVKQRVVTLEWAMMSYIMGVGLPEEEFAIEDEEDLEEGDELQAVGDDDLVDKWGHRASEYVSGKIHTKGNFRPWLVVEEEDLARFLASAPEKKGANEGGTIWEQYARSHRNRSDKAFAEHYRIRKEEIDKIAESIKAAAGGRPIIYHHPKVVGGPYRPLKRPKKVVSDDLLPFMYSSTRVPVPRQHYIPGSSFVRPTVTTPTGRSDTRRNVDPRTDPARGVNGCFNCGTKSSNYWYNVTGKIACTTCRGVYYRAEKRRPGMGLAALRKKKETPDVPQKRQADGRYALTEEDLSSAAASARGDEFSSEDDEALAVHERIYPHPPAMLQRPLDAAVKRPRLDSHARPSARSSPPVASGSGTSRLDAASIPRPQHHPPAVPRPPSSSVASTSHPAVLAQPTPALEPAAFAKMGVPPSNHPAHLPYCCFCGDDTSGPFSDVQLAAANPKDEDKRLHRVGPRTACAACKRWYALQVAMAGLSGGDELETLAAVTTGLLQRGLDIRAKKVHG